jgi:hypothetical protein
MEPQQMGQIAKGLSLEQLKSFSQQVNNLGQARLVRKDGRVYDRQTLLHQNHIRDGGFGFGARLLDSEHLSKIDTLLREEGFEFLCTPGDRRPSIPEAEPTPLGAME